MKFPSIPVILGPTASGKTAVGIALAHKINAEIISIDSRQVYKDLPIGTATPSGMWKNGTHEVEGIPHHLMAHLAPDVPYTAGDFGKDAEKLIDDILKRGKTPLLVGGTGFYFTALYKGLPALPPRHDALRTELMEQYAREGAEKMHARLAAVDPAAAAVIPPQDKHKVARALEVFQTSGQPFSSWKTHRRGASKHSFTVFGLQIDRAEIVRRIENRSKQMLKNGMIEETEAVLKRGFDDKCPALQGFGFKEAVQVLRGQLSKTEFLEALIFGTTAYARRQRTWFRTQTKPLWVPSDGLGTSEISLKMNDFLNNPAKSI